MRVIPRFQASRAAKAPKLLVSVLLMVSALMAPRPLSAQAPVGGPRWAHIKTALFCTGEDVERLLSKPEDRTETLKYFSPLRLSKVYLENSSADASAVAKLREPRQP